jgi:hypothetical protein
MLALAGIAIYLVALPLTRLGNWFFARYSPVVTTAFGIACIVAATLLALACTVFLRNRMKCVIWGCVVLGIISLAGALGVVFTVPWLIPYTIDGSGMRSLWGRDILIIIALLVCGGVCAFRSGMLIGSDGSPVAKRNAMKSKGVAH